MKNHVCVSIFLIHIWFCCVRTRDNLPPQKLLSAVLCVFSIFALSIVGCITGSILCFVLVLLLVLRRVAAVIAAGVVCIAVVVTVVCIVVVVLHDNLHSENREDKIS